jgi:DNA polymerase-3 subunit delta'
MPDISAFLSDENNSRVWGELRERLASNGAPAAMIAIVGEEASEAFRNMYARAALCDSGSGEDGCPSCLAWMADGHPDMVVAGDGSGPPGVADCIDMQSSMILKPFVAKGRLGVIPASDALSLPAANSLLKIAEEPPEGGHLLFLAKEDNLIQTIRSRSWVVRFGLAENSEAAPPPVSPSEWASWFGKTKKGSLDDLAADVGSWARWLGANGDWRSSASLRNALYISKKRHMPVSMVQDAMLAILREGVSIGQIFGDIR